MAIKRKDGSIYKVNGPNKIMITQERWGDSEDFILHNFNKQTESTFEQPRPIPQSQPEPIVEIVQKEIIATPVQPPQVDESEIIPLIQKKPQPEIVEVAYNKTSVYRKSERCTLFCLPAEKKELKDEVYNQSSFFVSYGDPFKFAAVIIEASDYAFSIWTTVKNVTKSSIVFHSEDRRWWKVSSIENERTNDGFIIICRPSELRPNFESV